ncbi:MAG: GlsB/YeaQ/YmgE family stress response membrane protein [Alistipes sp.]|jgi:uncharacterized membrane protein YeaQ/YmgE (transglycosylase-associated protein family)|nr:GlsB/YeaQ/YmgE family stress response membrane protein [Alistipes sp.]
MNFVWFILIGLVAGWLGGLIVRGSGSGFWINLLVGVVGSVLGGWIMSLLDVGGGTLLWQLIVAVVGAVVLLLIVGLFSKKSVSGS